MNIYRSKYVELKPVLALVDQWVKELNESFPEFPEMLRGLSREQRFPYLQEPAAREQVPKKDVPGAWFHLYARICYIQETLAMSAGNKLILLETPGGAKYDDLDGLVYDADLSQGLIIGNA